MVTEDVGQFLTQHSAERAARRRSFPLHLPPVELPRPFGWVAFTTWRDGALFVEWQSGKKGGAFVSIPLAPRSLVELRAAKIEGPAYLLNEYGRSYATGASQNKLLREVGRSNRSQYGPRTAMGEFMAKAGATRHQVMSATAHTKPAAFAT